jgi:hypothetical protein
MIERLAKAACDVFGAISCVVTTPRRSAGAAQRSKADINHEMTGPFQPLADRNRVSLGQPAKPRGESDESHVMVGNDATDTVTITLTLADTPLEGAAELLDLIAMVAAAKVREPATSLVAQRSASANSRGT